MDLWKCTSSNDARSLNKARLIFSNKAHLKAQVEEQESPSDHAVETDVDIDLREVYFLIMHFLSAGPCHRTCEHFWNELLEHQLLPRRYHAWFSRSAVHSGDDKDDGISFPLNYTKLVERYPHIEKDHLVKLLKQLILSKASPLNGKVERNPPSAADVPTLLGTGSFSLLDGDRKKSHKQVKPLPAYMRWPHMQVDQVRGLSLREIGGGFTKHHRAPSIRSACYAVAKPSTMVQKMEMKKRLRGHRDAVYCAIFDRSGRYVITGSDDRLVKIWSMETAFCLASCRGHEGDITDLAVSSNNAVVASAANDFVIRVWRLPDGLPISVLQGHTAAVTAIAFSPRPSNLYHLLSSSDDGTCRIWDARSSQSAPRIYVPRPSDAVTGRNNASSSNGPSSSNAPQSRQILCCAYNANGTVFVTGSSDTFARVWNACKSNTDDSEQPIHEMDILSGHENDVNYVQFSGCAVVSRSSTSDTLKEENIPKFKNFSFCHDNIVTCSRDGSAIIWVPRSRRFHGKAGRWTRAYHLKVPPPPLPPQPPRGGPRQRLLPTPRGVNMIVWSLDNRFVLAAIMDCRICVWNAIDGSLVHSLTGHSASSYVLDVHPFNPRIAMSAGYDGLTIVWDIWEGTPIRIFQIGGYKLVDGKFSPDGTSIVLSDDVGQIYFLNTGQGESHKDAKYDQFFLGDYRPLIRDSNGNVLDQETQLVPHKRNIQDPLCDSSMIPYPEPYQSMYQKRRLGALGMEWRPSSIKFATGLDINLGQDYQMPPLADLERMIEPMPEFIEALYLEQENEIISDDNDSEYNVTEEFCSEGQQRGISESSFSDPECSSEDSDIEDSNKDGLRRSRRRNHGKEVELMTSSGRRVKKRNLDERAGTISRSNRTKRSKSGRTASKRKSSKAITLRPQRVAARNALNMFSQISGTSTGGEDEDDSEDDSSDSESVLQDSILQSYESDKKLQTMQLKCTKEEQPSLHEDKRPELPDSQLNVGSRKRLVLKFSLSSKKSAPPEDITAKCDNEADLVYPLSRSETNQQKMIGISSKDPCSSSADAIGEKENKIRWGELKIRTSKRLRSDDVIPTGASTGLDAGYDACGKYDVNGTEEQLGTGAQDLDVGRNKGAFADDAHKSTSLEMFEPDDHQLKGNASTTLSNGSLNKEYKNGTGSGNCRDYDSLENEIVSTNYSNESKENPPPKSTKLRIKMKSPSKLKIVPPAESLVTVNGDIKARSPSTMEHNLVFGDPEEDIGTSRLISLQLLHPEADVEDPEPAPDVMRKTRSMKMKATSREPSATNQNFKARGGYELVGMSKNVENFSIEEYDQIPSEERMANSKMAVRTRSSRTRRGGYSDNKPSYSSQRKPNQPLKKISWLMLSEIEEGYRYIPQLGDEVVYLRQGHQELIKSIGSSGVPPWSSFKGNLGAVEICKVEGIEYIVLSGSGDSGCKITLKFIDPTSNVFNRSFKLTLPELINFSDFVVEKTLYDAARERQWTIRDKCMVWWRSEGEEGGRWWEGRIVDSKPISLDFPDSPWERYVIQYKSEPANDHRHSPWELHDPEVPFEWPYIDSESRDTLLSLFAKLERSVSRNQDCYGFQKLNQVAQKSEFSNRFPVPLYPEVIQLRLENNYYRTLEAVKHDIMVMLTNARTYFLRNSELSSKMKRLSDWFTKKLSKI